MPSQSSQSLNPTNKTAASVVGIASTTTTTTTTQREGCNTTMPQQHRSAAVSSGSTSTGARYSRGRQSHSHTTTRASGNAAASVSSVGRSSASSPRGGARRNTQGGRPDRGDNKNNNNNDDDNQNQNHPTASLPDQLAGAALAGTVEFLKLAGGLTLSATGKVAMPSLKFTQAVVLPQLWAATVDQLSNKVPLRVQDWFRILSTSVRQFIQVLGQTPKGAAYLRHWFVVGADALECAASPATRQALVEAMGVVVHLSQALATPEMRAFLERLATAACRWTTALASPRSHKLYHDVAALTWSGFEVLADPHATLAMAEVTAYLCYALDMEEAELDVWRHAQFAENAEAAAQRRRARDAYQRSTYGGPNIKDAAANDQVTVEEVILNSLGCWKDNAVRDDQDEHPCSRDTGDDDDVDEPALDPEADEELSPLPNDAIADDNNDDTNGHNDDRHSSSLQRPQQSTDAWHEQVHKEVDLEYLREHLAHKATQADRQRIARAVPTVTTMTTATLDVDVEDVEDVDLQLGVVETVADDRALQHDVGGEQPPQRQGQSLSERRPRKRVALRQEDDGSCAAFEYAISGEEEAGEADTVNDMELPSMPNYAAHLPGEAPEQHFYRIVDEIMTRQREAGMDRFRNRTSLAGTLDGRVTAPSRESPMDSMRHRLQQLRHELRTASNAGSAVKSLGAMPRRRRKLLLLGLGVIICTIFLWVGLGCYGLYVLLWAPNSPAPLWGLLSTDSRQHKAAQHQEVVIRVVREVVHVDAQGNVVLPTPKKAGGRASTDGAPVMSDSQMDRLTECVAQTV